MYGEKLSALEEIVGESRKYEQQSAFGTIHMYVSIRRWEFHMNVFVLDCEMVGTNTTLPRTIAHKHTYKTYDTTHAITHTHTHTHVTARTSGSTPTAQSVS